MNEDSIYLQLHLSLLWVSYQGLQSIKKYWTYFFHLLNSHATIKNKTTAWIANKTH